MKPTVLICVLSLLGSQWMANAQETSAAPLKTDMALNLSVVNQLLYGLLVSEDYDAIAKNAGEIILHAQDIKTKVPESAKNDLTTFQSFALQLEANATILRNLSQRIKTNGEREDRYFLHNSAALAYGQLVTGCVSCHQHFRIASK
jgi:cytochrome c551/c552